MSPNNDMLGSFSLAGKVAVVTGAASGVGRETARLFTLAGARVVLADIDRAGLDVTAALLREAGGEPLTHPTNVARRSDVEALADETLRECGRLDCWINSAGITLWAEVGQASADAAEQVVAVNMMGSYWGCAAAGRIMRQLGRGGAIVNVSSTAGDSPVARLCLYGMSKAGVNQLTRVCALEMGSDRIRVNAVVLGVIDTPIIDSMYRDAGGAIDPAMREQIMAQMRALSPLGLVGRPIDVAMALLYLASDAARFVTGTTLRVSGGV
jgi:3-oxoacyl-[acyl-carrier protein] reductase